ncbi:MAG: transposase [Holophagaceae bacterium]|nr:transposase [Holophagaceae bacterium]
MAYRGQGAVGLKASERAAFHAEKKTSGIADAFGNLFSKARSAFAQGRTYQKARSLAFSAIAGLGRRTVSGMLCAGAMQFEDWSGAYRLFERERIDRKALFAPVMQEALAGLDPDGPLVVMMDDTLVRKRGKKVHGTAWKRDPLGPPFHTNFVWGQRFLQLSVALPDKGCPGRARSIPIDFIHAPSAAKPKKNAPEPEWEEYSRQREAMKVSAVGASRLKELSIQMKDRKVLCALDGGFTNRTVFRGMPRNVALIGRIRKDAKLFSVPDSGKTSNRGRQRMYGDRLPTPEQWRQDESIDWTAVEAFGAGKLHQFDVKVMPAVRWAGTGNQTVQVVVVRPLAYRPRKGAKLLYRDPAYLTLHRPGHAFGRTATGISVAMGDRTQL